MCSVIFGVQGEEMKDIKVEIKGEERTLMSGAQQFMEEGCPLYSPQEDHTIPHHHQVGGLRVWNYFGIG